MKLRKIIHVDMDCFYAAVETRDNPEWRGKPLAVGGPSSSRGVVATCNYEARAFGVRSAMPSGEAKRRCPELLLVPGRMSVYKAVSAQIRAIFQRYTEIIEPLSLDEAYLDVSENTLFSGSATLLAQQIRSDIFEETGLTASAGIAPNKFLAKIASDENKPNGQFVITPDQCAEFAASLPLRRIPGVGPKTAERLTAMGLTTGRDVLSFSSAQLADTLGKFGPVLLERARGVDHRPVQTHRVRKSIGVETTLSKDLSSESACIQALSELLPELVRRIGGRGFVGIQIKLKFADFQQTTVSRQHQELEPSILTALLAEAYRRGQGKGVRLVGISVNLPDEATQTHGVTQLSLSLDDD